MKIKVCGIKDSRNIEELSILDLDFMGFVFYKQSKRFVETTIDIPSYIDGVGVFVNEDLEYILSYSRQVNFNHVQLHGYESPSFCEKIKKQGFKVIKSFSVDETFNFNKTKEFSDVVDYFLFDTKDKNYGGSGKKFDWNLLNDFNSSKPFFLSGGIGLEDVEKIKEMNIFGVDINSKFEIEPGFKDFTLINEFIKALK